MSARRTRPAQDTAIEAHVRAVDGWRGDTLTRMRTLILEADPGVEEVIKWRKPSKPGGVLAWSHAGMLCTGEVYAQYVKLTFAKGASMPDPAGLFNAGLAGNARRAIDLRERDIVDAEAFKALVRAAVSANLARG